METTSRPFKGADLLIAAVLAAAMAVAAVAAGPTELISKAGATVVAAGLLALAMRRHSPFTAAITVAVVVIVEVMAAPQGSAAPAFLALMVASYSLGAHARRPMLLGGLAVSAAGVAADHLLSPPKGYSHASAISFFTVVLVLAPAAIGGVVRIRANVAKRLRVSTETMRADAATRLEDNRIEHRLRLGADTERVVLSGLEGMRPHAEVRDLADAKALRDLGREMLGRMRGLLAELRQVGDDQVSPREPSRSVADLRTQVDRVLTAGATASRQSVPGRRARWIVLTGEGIDTLLAVVGGVYALLIVATNLSGPYPLGRHVLVSGLGAAAALPLIWARRWPLAATSAGIVAVIAFDWSSPLSDPLGGLVAAVALIVFPLVLGAAGDLAVALVGLAICLAGAVAASLTNSATFPQWIDLLSSAAIAVGSWAAGRVLRAGAAALEDSAAARASEEQRQRDELRLALDADRARVARDLHDAVGHAMTGIVMQATAATRVWNTAPDLAARHVSSLRATVAEALDDLGPLVMSVALDSLDGVDTPGLETVTRLAERARACGLRLRVLVEGAIVALHASVDAVAYRVVQEALTNAARHAPGADVVIRIDYSPDTVALQIRNEASPYGAAETAGAGHGLRGMAERVSGCGGTLQTGPTPSGGFQVSAVLPRVMPA